MFSAWVLWANRCPDSSARFEWRIAAWSLNVPLVGALFHQLTQPSRLRELGLDEVLDWAGSALNRVERVEFFRQFHTSRAVQHFYEPFLAAFDPQLRRDFGVWYTPPEVVSYMVSKVDRILRVDFWLENGLADDGVYVLDPCTGTGSFLVEVLKRIHEWLAITRADALVAGDVAKAARTRIIGFEILPAPFSGSPLADRVASTTAWRPARRSHRRTRRRLPHECTDGMG